MKETEKVDSHVIVSVILGVDTTEVYLPEHVNEVAKRHGLVPGSSLDLTNGWVFTKPPSRGMEKDQDRGSVPHHRVTAMHPVQCVTRVKHSQEYEQVGLDGMIQEEKSRGN